MLSPCRGRYLVALGHAYHPEEFVCSQCGKVLEEGGFFEEKGAIFCPSCYDVRYAPSCAKCKKKITGVSGAGGGRWAGGQWAVGRWAVGRWAGKKVNIELVSVVQCGALSMNLQDLNHLTAETVVQWWRLA